MLELYQFEQCPYSTKVRKKLSELNIDYICRNTDSMTRKRQVLSKVGGENHVPLLVDVDKDIYMYGSKDIIEFLEKNYS